MTPLLRLQRPGLRCRSDEQGQALAIVLGLVGLLTIGGLALAQASLGAGPVLARATLAEDAHEAVLAGLDAYLAAINANPDAVVCNSTNQSSGFCAGTPSFQAWQALPDSTPGAAPAWYWIADPSLGTAGGQLTLTVIGAAGTPGTATLAYEEAQVALQAGNDFLRNVLWMTYDQIDPELLDPQGTSTSPGPTCGIYWQTSAVNEWTGQSQPKAQDQLGPSSQCTPVAFITGDSLDGPLFVKDAIFVCGRPSFQVVHTEDPDLAPGTFTVPAGPGCPNNPRIQDSAASTAGSATPDETMPPTNAALLQVAERLGCVFEGPTELTFQTSGDHTLMAVDSPDTPSRQNPDGPNDALDAAANPNQCLPTQPGGTVPTPTDGVIYVQDCPANDQACSGPSAFDPLAGTGQPGTDGPTDGDAIVQGTVGTPLTVAAANNVVIDGNLCYPSSTGACPTSPQQIENLPGQPAPILGLIAQNFVVLNHPVQTSPGNFFSASAEVNAPVCGQDSSPGPGHAVASPPDCDLDNPVVDAVSLSLSHAFVVANWNQGQPLGTLTVLGAIAQNWRGPVGTYTGGGAGNQVASGYLKDYVWDTRLGTIAPPYYLNPGTASWDLAAVTFRPTLGCPLSGCSAPPGT